MQTNFTPAQLKNPATAAAEKILRACVHCGFCNATCPTFVLLGDELDSPRGRIYLIKDMLEQNRPADALTVKHIDRCLSCLACMMACPSGVNYMHLVDGARSHIEMTFARPLSDRLFRAFLGAILPYPNRFRLAVAAAPLARPFTPLYPRFGRTGRRLAAMLRLAPRRIRQAAGTRAGVTFPAGAPIARVALLSGCVQQVLRPSINDSATCLLTRLGIETVLAKGEGCCGALLHHLGKETGALAHARANIDVWSKEIEEHGLDAILITASGCGTMIKDYGFLLRDDSAYAAKAARVSALAKDVTEFLGLLDLPRPAKPSGLTVAYHSACSMQHGQKIDALPRQLLTQAGFKVRDIPEGHLCCGSAGTYNILEPEIAARLRGRKLANILQIAPGVVATGNIGCIAQIASGTSIPVLHTPHCNYQKMLFAFFSERTLAGRVLRHEPYKEMVAMIHKASFDIQTPDAFFTKVVLPQYAEFTYDNACARKALIAIIVAYHMCELTYKTKCNGAKSNFQSDDINDLFELGRRITNGTKQFRPRIATKRQAGFSSAFSDGFARPLIIVRDDQSEISADQLLRGMIAHWEREKAAGKLIA